MSGWTKKYQADEPHSYQMHLLNYRADAAPGEQHDGCVVETFARTKPSPILARYFPMTPRGFLLPDSEWIEGEHALQRAKRLVERPMRLDPMASLMPKPSSTRSAPKMMTYRLRSDHPEVREEVLLGPLLDFA